MKANEAPGKTYVDAEDRLSDSILYGFTEKRKDNDIEYIRTDAFIEKACDFISSLRRLDDNVIEEFKKYMKGE